MSNRTKRNILMLSQIPDGNPFKHTLAPRLFDIGADFEKDMQAIELSRKSPEWRQEQAQGHRRRALRDLRDAQTGLKERRAETDVMDAATRKLPPTDPNDIVGFLRRQELRAALRSMNAGQRELTLNDPAFADAMLEQPPVLSGLFLAEDFEGTVSPEIQKDRDTVAAAKENTAAGSSCAADCRGCRAQNHRKRGHDGCQHDPRRNRRGFRTRKPRIRSGSQAHRNEGRRAEADQGSQAGRHDTPRRHGDLSSGDGR
jgi:hypothetical protein